MVPLRGYALNITWSKPFGKNVGAKMPRDDEERYIKVALRVP